MSYKYHIAQDSHHRFNWSGEGRKRRSAMGSHLMTESSPLDTVPENPKDSIENDGSTKADAIQLKPFNKHLTENTGDQNRICADQLFNSKLPFNNTECSYSLTHAPITMRRASILFSFLHQTATQSNREMTAGGLHQCSQRPQRSELLVSTRTSTPTTTRHSSYSTHSSSSAFQLVP